MGPATTSRDLSSRTNDSRAQALGSLAVVVRDMLVACPPLASFAPPSAAHRVGFAPPAGRRLQVLRAGYLHLRDSLCLWRLLAAAPAADAARPCASQDRHSKEKGPGHTSS